MGSNSTFDWFVWTCCGLWLLTPVIASLVLWNWRMHMAKRRAVIKVSKEKKDGRSIRTLSFEVDERLVPQVEEEDESND
jgi:hypothetical protein